MGLRKRLKIQKIMFTEIGEEIKVQSKKREELKSAAQRFPETKRRTCEACVRS